MTVPTEPPAPPAGVSEIQILGPVRAVWAGDAPAGMAATVTEIAAYLLLHPGGTSSAVLADALTNRERTLAVESVRTHVSTLRRAVGADHLPQGGAAGYQLHGVGTDLDRLEQLARGGLDQQLAALALISGAPFSHSPRGAYEWAYHHAVVARAEAACADLALAVAAACPDPVTVDWALSQALKAAPSDHRLHHARLDNTQGATPDTLTNAWHTITRHLADNDEPIPDDLLDHYNRLRHARTG